MNRLLLSHRYRNTLVILVILFFMSVVGTAQPALKLSLKDAINYAIQNKAEAHKAQLEIENAQYKIDETKAGALPQVSGSFGVQYNPLLQVSALPGELAGQPGTTLYVALGQKWSANGGISVSQKLYDQSLTISMKAQKATKEYYMLALKSTDEQIIEAVAQNYYQVLVQRQKIVVLDSNILNTIKSRDIIKGQYESGLAKKIDLDRTVVNISNLQTDRLQLINDLQLQENTLKFYMGMPITALIDIPKAEFDKIIPIVVAIPDSSDIQNRTELQLLQKQEQLLEYQRQVNRSAYYPTLSFSGNYNYQGIGNKFPIGKGLAGGVNWFDYSTLGLTLNVPIFNGFATRARIKQAEISIKKIKEDQQMTILSINLGYENAKTQINNSLATLKNQLENIKLAKDILDNTRNNYNNGLATLTDVLDAETSLTQSQNNYSTALLNYKLAELQVIKSKGNLKSLLN